MDDAEGAVLVDFNSIKVRLERGDAACSNHFQGDFNSIKVRLELPLMGYSSPGYPFQFHKGTIRTSATNGIVVNVPNFNSIKVRLEPSFPKYPPSGSNISIP